MDTPIPALVVMGVAGCGKSSVGAAIAEQDGGRLIEGDAFHPAANIAKMSAGIPLDDEDRAGWLTRLGEELAAAVAAGDARYSPAPRSSAATVTSCARPCPVSASSFSN